MCITMSPTFLMFARFFLPNNNQHYLNLEKTQIKGRM